MAKASAKKIVSYFVLGCLGAAVSLILLVALLQVIRAVFYEPYSIPSGAMIPTLLVGDHMYAAKWPYLGEEKPIKRGQVLLFKAPNIPSTIFVKRVIGLPGDKIEIKGFRVFVNDKELPRTERPHYGDAEMDTLFDDHNVFEETLDGNTYSVMWKKEGKRVEEGTFEVPAGKLFFMGDNRSDAYDSRMYGNVDYSSVIGRATYIFFSSSEAGFRMWRIGLQVK